ncbi:MAG: serine/threonine-protein phosphatase [Chloroflexi bacterium]|nr:serine/threonine-protein phosphatase [Chloroflexota bacterium]
MPWPFATRKSTALHHASLTDAGRRHKQNEDAVTLIVAPEGAAWGFDLAAIVCDGVSGQPRGEMASALSIEAFRSTFSRADDHPTPVASTVVALVLTGRHATIGHVGNSRAYLLHGGELERLTIDHSFVAEQIRQGMILASEARRHPMRSRISRALGTPQADAMDVSERDAEPGDLFLLSTDGLHDIVDETEILRAISDDLGKTARRLVDLANAAGGPDNITVALCRVA